MVGGKNGFQRHHSYKTRQKAGALLCLRSLLIQLTITFPPGIIYWRYSEKRLCRRCNFRWSCRFICGIFGRLVLCRIFFSYRGLLWGRRCCFALCRIHHAKAQSKGRCYVNNEDHFLFIFHHAFCFALFTVFQFMYSLNETQALGKSLMYSINKIVILLRWRILSD